TIGGLAENLAALRLQPAYDKVMESGKNTLGRMGWVGDRAFQLISGLKVGVKHSILPQEMFSDLGLKYIDPVDGHGTRQVETATRHAQDYGALVIVHTITHKGQGFAPAENDDADQKHATGVIVPATGVPKKASKPGWTQVFSSHLTQRAGERDDVVA